MSSCILYPGITPYTSQTDDFPRWGHIWNSQSPVACCMSDSRQCPDLILKKLSGVQMWKHLNTPGFHSLIHQENYKAKDLFNINLPLPLILCMLNHTWHKNRLYVSKNAIAQLQDSTKLFNIFLEWNNTHTNTCFSYHTSVWKAKRLTAVETLAESSSDVAV